MAPPKRPSPRDDTTKDLPTRRYLPALWAVAALDILLALEYPVAALVLAIPLLSVVRWLSTVTTGVRSSLVARYGYNGPSLIRWRIPLVVVLAAMAAGFLGFKLGTVPGILATGAALATLIHGFSRLGDTLFLARRFVSLGDRCVFHEDIEKVVLRRKDSNAGSPLVLEIHTRSGAPLLVEQERFPTKARKAPKIATNQRIKMAKVATKLLKQLERFPHVVIEGSLDAPVPAGNHPGRTGS